MLKGVLPRIVRARAICVPGKSSGVIRGHQGSSGVIRGHQESSGHKPSAYVCTVQSTPRRNSAAGARSSTDAGVKAVAGVKADAAVNPRPSNGRGTGGSQACAPWSKPLDRSIRSTSSTAFTAKAPSRSCSRPTPAEAARAADGVIPSADTSWLAAAVATLWTSLSTNKVASSSAHSKV